MTSPDYDKQLCGGCNGTGEGRTEHDHCMACGGSGVEWIETTNEEEIEEPVEA